MRRAILIASAKFDADSGIEPLLFPENDVTALESILRSEEFGFDPIIKVIDQTNNTVVERLDELMSESNFDDFILIYFSGHGKVNATGELFLSCRNTKESRLNSTGLKYRHIMDLLETHARDRVAIVLDCCYAGRAVSGLKGSVQEQVKSELNTGRGIFVLGASGATQTAEERELDGHGIFTKQIIDGLTTGDADVDNDGQISFQDLAKYVKDGLLKKGSTQVPIAAGMIKSGELILGTNRKVIHSRTVSAIRLKIEGARLQISKRTYRAIEDYLDDISTRTDFGGIAQEQEFHSLQTFAAGGPIEVVVIAFRRPIEPEPSERREPRPVHQDAIASTPVPLPGVPSKPDALPPSRQLDKSDDRAASSLLPASERSIDGIVGKPAQAEPHPGLMGTPPVSPPPSGQPEAQASLRVRLYALLGMFAVFGVLAGGIYWAQDSQRNSKTTPLELPKESQPNSTTAPQIILSQIPGPQIRSEWPTRPVTMVVPFAAGGALDFLGRLIQEGIGVVLGQPALVENIGGAGGTLGSSRVATAQPDGYRFVLGNVITHAISQTSRDPLYNSVTDFAPVALIAEQSLVLVARKDFPAVTLANFIAHAKANQAKMKFGSAGEGTLSYLACAMLNAAIGVHVTHVPHGGSGLVLENLISGRIDYMCIDTPAALTRIKNRSITAIAILARSRSPSLPDLASAQEQGLANFEATNWSALFLPKGTPASIVEKLNGAAVAAMDSPAVQRRVKDSNIELAAPGLRSTKFLRAFVASEVDKWAAVGRAAVTAN